MSQQVILITGASSGIGLVSALDLLARGHIVYGGARRVALMDPIVQAGGHALALDITDEASMAAAVDAVIAAEGRIDALVNNAGFGGYGAVEDMAMDDARHQIEVNIFGLARMTQLVLPHMRKAGSGRIVNIGSVGGSIWTPLGAWYHGTKWFVEGFTHALRVEVEPFGIHPITVAPGIIRTEFYDVMTSQLRRVSGQGAYARMVEGLLRAAKPEDGSDPQVIARAIAAALTDAKPRTIYRAGKFGWIAPKMIHLIPHRMWDRILRAQMK